MHTLRTNKEKKSSVRFVFLSKYIWVGIGLICVLITIVLWKTTEVGNLEQLSQNVESITEIYASKIEGRMDTINFDLEELAGYGPPNTLEKEDDWDMRSNFYIQNIIGIANIVWLDEDLIVRRVMPTENSEYTINNKINGVQYNFDYTNLIFPVYNDDVIVGFILGNIDVSKLILSVGYEFENDYMIQVFDENQLLASSDNWQQLEVDISAKRDISFNSKTFSFVVTPTKEMVSLNIRNSYFILIFGLLLSIIISGYFITTKRTIKIKTEQIAKNSKRNEIIVEAFQRNFQSNTERFDYILKEIVNLSESKTGFLFSINKDGKSEINTYFSIFTKEKCDHSSLQNIIKENHLIQESLTEMVPVVENNYLSKPNIPKMIICGEEVHRFTAVPVQGINEKHIIVLINKKDDYSRDNTNQISILLTGLWTMFERAEQVNEIEYMSFHDSLTGLYNRRFFEEQLKRLDNPRNLPLSIIMGDVNGLKLINDAFGHKTGDKLLEMIGEIISTSIRGNDIAARWGGDEFTILLPNSGADAAEVLINRIQKKIKSASFEHGKISISFGLDTKKDKEEDINEKFTSAEEFMYQNKLEEINSIRGQTINTIMTTLFEKSIEVKEHSMRVSELSVLIAEKMGLSKTNTNDIKTMGLIHDIGKIVIDLNILDKPGKLTKEERNIIQQHPLSGSRMLNSSHEYSRLAAGVLHHHERIDGKGYPNGIYGDQIPIESKIIAVADAFDAMTAERPYRLTPLSSEDAIAELRKHSGTQFDKTVVNVFVNKVLK